MLWCITALSGDMFEESSVNTEGAGIQFCIKRS